MKVFSTSANQMLVLFIFMAVGFLLNRKKLLPNNASTVLSKLETYLLVPCLVFNTFYKYCTVENFSKKWIYLIYATAIVIISVALGSFLAKLFTKDSYIRRIYAYGLSMANFAFMGNAVVLGVFGEEILFDYMIFTLPFNLYVYSIGTASLIPENENNKFSFKVFINPIFISIILGFIFGLTQIKLPAFVLTGVSATGACMSPIAMILTGFVIGNYSLKMLSFQKKVIVASIIRLIILPTLFVLCLKAINTDDAIVRVAFCATGMPLGLSTVVFPAAYGGDTVPGASMALVSHLLSVVTIPLMFIILL